MVSSLCSHSLLHPAGAGCTVYDVVINTAFYSTVRERPVLQNLLLTMVLEALEGKYGILLTRGGWVRPMCWEWLGDGVGMYRVGGSVGRVNGDNCQFVIHAVVIAEFSHLSKAASPY